MSSFASVTSTFARALASQAETIGSARLVVSTGDPTSTTSSAASLIATVDPTRAAFASALQRIDVANAPLVEGPYVVGTPSGPLTEADIFDPSHLYSLPGRDLVVFGEDAAVVKSSLAVATHPGAEDSQFVQTDRGGAALDDTPRETIEIGSTQAGANAIRSTIELSSGSRPAADVLPAGLVAPRPPSAFELAIAGYLSLIKPGSSPLKRKVSRRFKAREDLNAPVRSDIARSNETEGETAPS